MSSLSSIWLALMLQLHTIYTQYTWEKETGANGEDIWRSAHIRPILATSYGNITLGQIMSIEFDFIFHGRVFAPDIGHRENFFRIGHSATAGGTCENESSRYPAMWLGSGGSNTGYLDISFVSGSVCSDTERPAYDNLNIGITHHIKILLNNSMVMIDITGGGQADHTETWPRQPTLDRFLGVKVPVWFSTDHASGNGENVGNGTFTNITIISQTFTAAPSLAPTSSPTNGTIAPSDAPTTLPPSSTPTVTTSHPTLTPTIEPTTDPTTMNPSTTSPTAVGATPFPSHSPTLLPTNNPTIEPTVNPSSTPTSTPTSISPTDTPSDTPTNTQTDNPTLEPTVDPTVDPTIDPTTNPTVNPSRLYVFLHYRHLKLYEQSPTDTSVSPTELPTTTPTELPTDSPSKHQTQTPSVLPSVVPSKSPTTKRPSYPAWWPYTTTTAYPDTNITIFIDSVDDDDSKTGFYPQYEYVEITIFITVIALVFCTAFCFLGYLMFRRRISSNKKKKNLEPPQYHVESKHGVPDQMAIVHPRYSKAKSKSHSPYQSPRSSVQYDGDDHKTHTGSGYTPNAELVSARSKSKSKSRSHKGSGYSGNYLKSPTSPKDRIRYHQPSLSPSKGSKSKSITSASHSLNISVMQLMKDTTPTPHVSPNAGAGDDTDMQHQHRNVRMDDDVLLHDDFNHEEHQSYAYNSHETYDKPYTEAKVGKTRKRDKRRRKTTLDYEEEYGQHMRSVELEYAQNEAQYEVVLDGYVDGVYTNQAHEGNALEDTERRHKHRRQGANRYEFIRKTLQRVDSQNYDRYFENFEKHRVEDHRLGDLLPEDWKELIPAIGPRNDFKRLWTKKFDDDNPGHATRTRDSHYAHNGEFEYDAASTIPETECTDDIPDDLQSELLSALDENEEDTKMEPDDSDDSIDRMNVKVAPPYIEDEKDVEDPHDKYLKPGHYAGNGMQTPNTVFDDEEDSSESEEDEYYNEDDDEDEEEEVKDKVPDTPYEESTVIATPSETYDNEDMNEQLTFADINDRYKPEKSVTKSKHKIEKQSVLSALSSAPSGHSSTMSESSYYNESEESHTETQSQSIDEIERERKEKEKQKEKQKKKRKSKSKSKSKAKRKHRKPRKSKRGRTRAAAKIPPTLPEVEEPSHFSDDFDDFGVDETDDNAPITPLTPLTPLPPMIHTDEDEKQSSSESPPPKKAKEKTNNYLMSPAQSSHVAKPKLKQAKHHNMMPSHNPSIPMGLSNESVQSGMSLGSAVSGHTIMSDVSSNPPMPMECDPEVLMSPLAEVEEEHGDYEDTIGIPNFEPDIESDDEFDDGNGNDNDNDYDYEDEYEDETEYEDEYEDENPDESVTISQGLSDSGPEY